MCDMTECTATVIEQVIQTSVPGTKPVRLRTCPACDRRRCPACKTNVLNPQATTCPNGHGL